MKKAHLVVIWCLWIVGGDAFCGSVTRTSLCHSATRPPRRKGVLRKAVSADPAQSWKATRSEKKDDCPISYFKEERKRRMPLVDVTKGITGVMVWYLRYARWLWDTSNKEYDLDKETGKSGITDRIINTVTTMESLARDEGSTIRSTRVREEFERAVAASEELKQAALIKEDASALLRTKDSSSPCLMARKTSSKWRALRKRLATGFTMGGVATMWIFSGNLGFASGFLLQTVLAQLEYYRMVMKKGIYPARRISLVSSFILYILPCYNTTYHEMVLPLAGIAIMLWMLIMRKEAGSISDISTSFMGLFYAGYLPSFWVRLRAIQTVAPTRFAVLDKFAARVPVWFQRIIPNPNLWTTGAAVTWWTYITIVASDVGAYFFGKLYGKTPLSRISKAAGHASPSKTVEGFVGGLISSVVMSTFGAFMLKWPLWLLSGMTYGIMLCIVALIGDLTASMFKRDAGIKDAGNFLPGHGGLLDRVDSYIFTAPPAYLFVVLILPLLEKMQ